MNKLIVLGMFAQFSWPVQASDWIEMGQTGPALEMAQIKESTIKDKTAHEEKKYELLTLLDTFLSNNGLVLKYSSLNPEQTLVPTIAIHSEGALFSIQAGLKYLPYEINVEYQFQNKNQTPVDPLVIEKLSVAILEFSTRAALDGSDFDLTVQLGNLNREENSLGWNRDDRFSSTENRMEFIHLKPKLTIALDPATKNVQFHVQGFFGFGVGSTEFSDKSTYFESDPEVMANIQARGGIDQSRVLYGSGGGVAMRVGLELGVMLSHFSADYAIEAHTLGSAMITVYNRESETNSNAPENTWHKEIKAINDYCFHSLTLSYSLDNGTRIIAPIKLDSKGRIISAGLGASLSLFR